MINRFYHLLRNVYWPVHKARQQRESIKEAKVQEPDQRSAFELPAHSPHIDVAEVNTRSLSGQNAASGHGPVSPLPV